MTKRERIENLIGAPECYGLPYAQTIDWYKWRSSLIDRLTEGSVEVNGFYSDEEKTNWAFDQRTMPHDTHTALLLDIQPLKRAVQKEELYKFLPEEMIGRIKEHGIC